MTDQPNTPAPDAAPAPAAPATTDVPARIAEIENVMRSDITRYVEEGLSDELLALRRSVAGQDQAETGDDGDEDADDGSDLDADAGDTEAAENEVSDQEVSEGEIEALPADTVPDEASGYIPAEIKGQEWTEADQPILDEFREEALDAGYTQAQFETATRFWKDRVAAAKQALKSRDQADTKAGREALAREFGAEGAKRVIGEIRGFLDERIDHDLASMIQTARTATGVRLINSPSFLRLLHNMASRPSQATTTAQPQQQDRRAMLQQDVAQIDADMRRDVDTLYREYKHTGMTASDYKLMAMRELAAEAPPRPSQTDLDSEERALIRLRNSDMQKFMFGNWNGTGRPPAERLHRLQSGRG